MYHLTLTRFLRCAVLGVCLTCTPPALSDQTAKSPPANQPNTAKLNTVIRNVTLSDLAGATTPLAQLADGPVTVLVFLSFDCPVANSYAAPLSELHQKYAKQGVRWIGVCCSDQPAEQLAQQAKDFHLSFPVYADPDFVVAEAVKATTTPEVFVLDHHRVLRYRGRIDDTYYARLRKNARTTQHDLQAAIDAVLAGKPVAVPATRPIGCPLRLGRPSEQEVTTQYTFYRDVLPILQAHCQECHRPGAVGPFSLMGYEDALNWATDIKLYTQTRQMPPWKPVDGPPFLNHRRLANDAIAILASWADGGTPAGNPQDAPKPRAIPSGWQLGTPDLVLEVPNGFALGASGNDIFRCFVLPTNLTEDKYVIGFEVQPGTASVVHHTLNYFDTTGKARQLAEAQQEQDAREQPQDHGDGYSVAMGVGFRPDLSPDDQGKPKFGIMGGWAPGQVPRFRPEGTGYFLPAGADLILQVHYHRNGKPETDRTKIGLYFSKKPVKQYRSIILPGRFLSIPANVENHKVEGSVWVDEDCTMYSVMPHMHLLGKQVQITMTPPNGERQTLVQIDDWDYNWQETYWFQKAIPVPAGTRFDILAIYDNSKKNPNNPHHPPQRVWYGEQTTNEMLFGFMGVTRPEPKPSRLKLRFTPKN